MSLERQDARCKLDPEDHAALLAICDLDGVTIAEFVERLLVPVIRKRVHDAIELHHRIGHLGIPGNNRETPGEAAKAGRR